MSKHIRGPWEAFIAGDTIAIIKPRKRNQRMFEVIQWTGFDGSDVVSLEEKKDIARLIAAAPKMLAALKAALSAISPPSNMTMHEWGKQLTWTSLELKATIAKAEGEECTTPK